MLLDAFPPEKQGQAMTIFRHGGAARAGRRADARRLHHRQLRLALDLLSQRAGRSVAPIYVPRAWSTIRNIYKLNGPRARNRREPFDTLGLCLLSVTMVSWEIMLSKGQEWDWFGDPFWRVQTLLPCSCSAWAA